MIFVLSTSSPRCSLAVFHEDGSLIWKGEREAPRAASGAAAALLEQSGLVLTSSTLFVADIGPGSLTGVKVGAAMVKAWGFATARPVAGITSFDLAAPDRVAAITARKGHVFVRVPGEEPVMLKDADAEEIYGPLERLIPHAANAGPLLGGLLRMPAELLVPEYVAEPLISTAKDPVKMGGRTGQSPP